MNTKREAHTPGVGAFPKSGGRHSISVKVGFILSLATLLAAANLYVVHTMLREFDGVAETVNVAGRLRMLTQKYAYDASRMFYADDEDDALFATAEEVQGTLNVLLTGGEYSGYRIVPLSVSRQEQIEHIRNEWHAYETAVWRSFGNPNQPATLQQLGGIEQISGRLLALADGLVHGVTADAQLMRQKSLVKIYVLVLMNVALLALLWFFSRTQLTRPLNHLAQMGRMLGQGHFDQRVGTEYRGEIGQLAAALNFAAGQISESLHQMAQDKEQLAQAEAMFRGLADNSMAGVYVVKEGRFEYVNQKMADMFLYDRDEMLTRLTAADLLGDVAHGLGENKRAAHFTNTLEQVNDAVTVQRRDGTLFDVEVFGSTMLLGDSLATIGIMHDVTERNRSNRGICLLSACNQAIVHARSELALQEAVCGILSRVGRYPFAWTGVKNGGGELKPLVQAEDRAGRFTRLLETPAAHLLTDSALAALLANKSMSSQLSGATLAQAAAWAETPKDLRIVSIPLRNAGQPMGVLSIYSEDRDAFGENEVVVLEEVAANLAYGMLALRAEALQHAYAQQLEHQAHHDALTGLANRCLLSDRLTQAIAMAHRLENQVAVLMLDLDKFKLINDTHGHATGDLLLQAVAHRLTCTVRKSDTVARLGGDEFVLLLTNIKNKDEVRVIADKIMATFRQPFQLGDLRLPVQSSMGIALYPDDGGEEKMLLDHADAAMYEVKQHGRNAYRFYSPDIGGRDVANAA